MTRYDCEFESEALAAALQCRWPERATAELRAHVAECRLCSDVVAVAAEFDNAREESRTAAVPDSGHVWRIAQLRARREDAAAAMRPIGAAQVLALGCVFGLIGACFGATSTWLQSLLPWIVSALSGPNVQVLLARVAEHGALIVGTAALTVLVPAAVLFAALRD